MADKVTGLVQAIEEEAARLLDEANAAGEEIIRKAREQAKAMEAEELPLEAVASECATRIEAARERARAVVEEAAVEAGKLRERVADKLGECAERIVHIVSGAGG